MDLEGIMLPGTSQRKIRHCNRSLVRGTVKIAQTSEYNHKETDSDVEGSNCWGDRQKRRKGWGQDGGGRVKRSKPLCVSLNFPGGSAGKESACNAGDPSSVPGWGKSAGDGTGYPLQYSWASLVAQLVKNPPARPETWVQLLGCKDLPGEGKG